MMKKKHIYIYLLGMLLLSVGCTGKFREFNTDQSGITDDDLLIDDNGFGIRLGIIQQGIYFNYDFGKGKNWPFQLIQNLNADMFSGYMHDGKPLNGGTHNSDYNMQDGTGLDLLEEIRQKGITVPFLLMSGDDDFLIERRKLMAAKIKIAFEVLKKAVTE